MSPEDGRMEAMRRHPTSRARVPDPWTGICYMCTSNGAFEVRLVMDNPPQRIVLRHGAGVGVMEQLSEVGDADMDHNDPMDVWLLVGSPMSATVASVADGVGWTALYELEEILQ